jgi:hypothetical protein
VLVFARHIGWLHCREHAAQLRDRHDAIRDLGARCVAIGTGDRRYARDFAERERIPFPILVDDDGAAARAASVERVGMRRLSSPASFPGTRGARRRGYFVGRPGKRVDQLWPAASALSSWCEVACPSQEARRA